MLMTVDNHNRALYTIACTFERVMGSQNLCALESHGEFSKTHRFLLGQLITGEPVAALHLAGTDLRVVAEKRGDPEEIAGFIVHNGVKRVAACETLLGRLREILPGEVSVSPRMAYDGGEIPGESFDDILFGPSPEDVFMVLQQSHEHYRSRLRYGSWLADVKARLRQEALEMYLISLEGEPVCTGSVLSRDDTCGVAGWIAVLPEHREKGIGTRMIRFLTRRILELHRTPSLLCDCDEMAELFRKCGYVETGRWGELTLRPS